MFIAKDQNALFHKSIQVGSVCLNIILLPVILIINVINVKIYSGQFKEEKKEKIILYHSVQSAKKIYVKHVGHNMNIQL